jgi:hypothetical protein
MIKIKKKKYLFKNKIKNNFVKYVMMIKIKNKENLFLLANVKEL